MNARAVHANYGEIVASTEIVHGIVETRAVSGGPGDGVGEDLAGSDARQPVGLSVQVLISGADTGIAHGLYGRF